MRTDRIIIALDADAFYAQAETIRDPSLRGKAVGVQQKNLIITTTYEARACGIQKGDAVGVVKAKCPEIIIKNGEDLSYYVELSETWRAYVENYAKGCPVEKLGLDELFLDVTRVVEPISETTGHVLSKGDVNAKLNGGAKYCADLREAIRRDLGLTTSGGIAWTKVLAKVASSVKKPFAQTTVMPDAVNLLIPDDMSLAKIPGIGPAMRRGLKERHIDLVGDLRSSLEDDKARRLCRGDDGDAPVKMSTAPKLVGVEDSFWRAPLSTEAEVLTALDALAEKLQRKLDVLRPKLSQFAVAVVVSVREYDQKRSSRQRAGSYDTANTSRILAAARDLLLDMLRNQHPKLLNLSLGLKFPAPAAPVPGVDSIDTFLTKGAIQNEKKRASYEAPSAEDLDEDVLNALPPDIRADIDRQRRLAAQVSTSPSSSSSCVRGGPKKITKTARAADFFAPRRRHVAGPDVATIVAMGFNEAQARSALERHPSVALAIESLLK